jgi:hypothetical protein
MAKSETIGLSYGALRKECLVPSPQWLDTGNNAWQLAAATFVGLQSIPGLTVLYGGIVKKKWAINSAFMAIYAFASVLVVWILFDFNMAFGPQLFPFIGTPGLATSAAFTTGQATAPAAAAGMPALTFPMATLIFLPVRVRCHHRHHPRRFSAWSNELHRVDDLLPGVDDPGLYGSIRWGHLACGAVAGSPAWAWLTSRAATSSILPPAHRVSSPHG